MAVSYTHLDVYKRQAYDQLYFVGNATDWGFVKMKQDVLDPYLFLSLIHI